MPVPVARRRGRILYALLLLLFALGVVPLLWTSYALVSGARETLELYQKGIQLDKARSLSQQVATYVRSLQSQVTAVARTLEVDAAPGQFASRVGRIREQEALKRYVEGTSPFNYISVVDAKGSGARSGVQLPEPAIQQLLEEGFHRGLEGKRMMSHPVIALSIKEPVIILAEPVTLRDPKASDGEGVKVEGVVLAVVTLGPLWTMTQQMAQEGLVDVYVVDGRGHLVAHSDPHRLSPEEGEPDLDVSNVEIVRKFLESRGRASSTEPFTLPTKDGVLKMLGTYTRVPDSGWGVIVQVDLDKAYYTAIKMRNESLLRVALVTVLCVFLGRLFAGQISRPIQELARGARRLAGGDYATRVQIRSGNEVGELADAFNHMGSEIQKAIEKIREQAAVNKELFMGSIKMLANAIDEKDVYTRGHSERVAYYSMVISKHMGMPADEVERVYLSGIIHDVGKIGIEDKILRKPAALTDEEYEIMKQHPKKGEHILEAVPMLKAMAGAGLMHHENVDGSGYPDGLKGDAIPLLGRIVSVADAFDAMTTDRPYSKAMTFEAALARLRFLAGKKFDATCVGAMEKAAAAGDLSPAKARRAAVAARQQAVPTSS
ncbi:MAG: HD domain-containing protein [Acidobacteria bacterium]|nr:HD domain-containing protein [Acidobacteriota bacterium]